MKRKFWCLHCQKVIESTERFNTIAAKCPFCGAGFMDIFDTVEAGMDICATAVHGDYHDFPDPIGAKNGAS